MAPKQQDTVLEPLSQSDHTGNVIVLPPQLSPPLADQRFALHWAVCAGLGCPPDENVDRLSPVPPKQDREDGLELGAEIVIPSCELQCFCLEMFGVGGADFTGPPVVFRLHVSSRIK